MERIRTLCKEYTDLTPDEIVIIEQSAKSLSAMASMFEADAFIDCPLSDGSGDAVVVAEAKPAASKSSYNNSVVGLIAAKEKEPAVYRSLQLAVPTRHMKAITQEGSNVVQLVEPIFSKDRVIGVFIVEQRMEAIIDSQLPHTKMWDADKLSTIDAVIEYRDSSVVDTIDEALIFVDKNDKVVFRNRAAKELHERLGFIDELIGADYRDISIVKMATPIDSNRGQVYIQDVKFGNYYFTVKTVFLHREDIDYIVSISDVTARKNQEKALVLKSVAFKEMHHRVKNNLQTIAALLRLQKNHAVEEGTKQALTDTISRILAIASTHQLMLETEIEEISLNEIISNVIESAVSCFKSDALQLDVDYFGGDFDVKYEKANAVALVINELIQNSVKHGFAGRKNGKISIMTFKGPGSQTQLIYKDDGRGFDVEAAKAKGMGMGFSIIEMMVEEKLKGHLLLSSGSSGTRVEIVF